MEKKTLMTEIKGEILLVHLLGEHLKYSFNPIVTEGN